MTSPVARYELDAKQLKEAILEYVIGNGLARAPKHHSVVQLELTHEGTLVIGAQLWFTREPEPGPDPDLVVRFDAITRGSKEAILKRRREAQRARRKDRKDAIL